MNKLPEQHIILGSGAVGAVLGHHLQQLEQGDSRVSFLVRNPDSPNCQMPRSVYRHNNRKWVEETQNLPIKTCLPATPVTLWLTTPSTALQSEWLQQVLSELSPDSLIVMLQPDMQDRAKVESFTTAPIIQAMIGLISFQSPLPGQTDIGSGFAWILPPRSMVFENSEYGQALAEALGSTRFPVALSKDLPWLSGRLGAIMIPAIAALEQANWSFDELWQSEGGQLLTRACKEAISVCAAYMGQSSKVYSLIPIGGLLRAVTPVARRIAPFDMEVYLHYHFSKVHDQTVLMLKNWQAIGHDHNIATPALGRLLHLIETD